MDQEGKIPEHAAAAERPGRRLLWIDTARGIGIILVVYGHVLRGLAAAGLVHQSDRLWLSDYAIYTFHMPLFFLLAGLNVEGSLRKGRMTFFRGKLWTIAYPYLLWSAIQGGIQMAVPGLVNHERSALFLVTMFWRPIAQFWFLYSLFLCHMLALITAKWRWLLAATGILAYALSLYAIGVPTTSMVGFYVAGILIGNRVKGWEPGARLSLMATLVSAGLFAVAEHFGRQASGAETASLFSLPAAITGIALICFLSHWLVCASARLASIFTSLGVMSMTIYILHVLAAASARAVLSRLGQKDPTEELIVGTLAGVGLPVFAHLLFQSLKMLPALGLAPLPSSKRNMRASRVPA